MATKRQIAKATRGSIAKWHAVSEGVMADNGADNCPLCDLFLNGSSESCIGCPVAVAGQEGCSGGAYDQWVDHHDEKHGRDRWPKENLCGTCTRLARAELKFLEGLVNA